ncbi:MAG: DUF4143 domain-containing protein [Bacilli bacterium]|nr:DUF4143 domain-containing protein [Bacilli bacterium]
MNISNYKNRIIDKKIDLYLKTFGAVLIEGPKWCGKTYAGLHASKSSLFLADPTGNFNNKNLALIDVKLSLDGEKPRLIDEWQEVPLVWDAIRGAVDSNPQKGQYIITGSTSVDKSKYIHSGTGRIARIRMRPMSLYESGKSSGTISVYDICLNKAPNILCKDVKLMDLIEYILVGGWPSVVDLDSSSGMLVAREYIKSVINEDIFKTDNIKRDSHKVELLFRSLARNESTTVSNTTLKKDVVARDYDDINLDSITDYLNLFNRLYLLENIPPYSSRIRSSIRVKQSEKRHFVDPSLPAALLSLTKDSLLGDLELLGFLFESLVLRDLLTYVDSFNGKLYHYQDYNGNEMDAVIELENGDWCGVEIKLGANRIDEAANNLVRINETIKEKGGKPAKSLMVICGLSNSAYTRPDGVYVVPITALKD